MIAVYVSHLRIAERTLGMTGEKAECFVFDWSVHSRNFAVNSKLVRDALKREVPATDRDWDPDGKRWSVKVEYRAVLAKLFVNFEAELKRLESQGMLF